MSINGKADILIEGGKIFCGKGLPEDKEFIAVADGKIVAVGKGQDEAARFKGPETKVIALGENELVIPGLHDNHIHLMQAGMLDKYADLFHAMSREEVAQIVSDFASTIPQEKWVIGFGWCRLSWEDTSHPTKETLDRVLPDRPVFLLDYELHGAWVNSKALELCGIDADTPDPPFGEIARDEKGQSTGYLYETALCLVGEYAFDFSDEMVEDLITRYMDNAVRKGITSVSDMTPYLGLNLAYENTYYRMDREGGLKIRVNAARNLFEDIDKVLEVKAKAESSGTGMYRVPYVKQFIDGVIANHTALLAEPYNDMPDSRGGSLLDLDQLNAAVEIAHENDISVRLHACGDGAVHAALDAYENAMKKYGKTKARHQIEHIEVILPEDIGRFGQLGVIASVQPEHIISVLPSFADNCYPQLLGPERDKYTWAFRSLLDAGAVLAAGSDAPVVEGDPFFGMYCGLTRIYPDGTPEGGWNPQEIIDIRELIHAYTWGAAYAERREDELGTLEEGKLADITVVDRDLLTSSPEQVKEAQVLYTIVNGKVVYEK